MKSRAATTKFIVIVIIVFAISSLLYVAGFAVGAMNNEYAYGEDHKYLVILSDDGELQVSPLEPSRTLRFFLGSSNDESAKSTGKAASSGAFAEKIDIPTQQTICYTLTRQGNPVFTAGSIETTSGRSGILLLLKQGYSKKYTIYPDGFNK